MDEPAVSGKTSSSRHAVSGEVLAKPGLELGIGSNLFRNSNGVIRIHGKEQLVIEINREQGLFLVTLDLYDEYGSRIAHLRRNALTLNKDDRFAVAVHLEPGLSSAESPSVRLTDLRSGGIVLAAAMTATHKVSILYGKLHSHRGIHVEITPNYCRIGSGKALFGDIVECRGGPVVIG